MLLLAVESSVQDGASSFFIGIKHTCIQTSHHHLLTK